MEPARQVRRRLPRRVYWRRRAVALVVLAALLTGLNLGARAAWQSLSSRLAAPATESSPAALSTESTQASPPAAEIVACDDADIQVAVSVPKGSSAAVGSIIGIRADISNVGEQACLRDVGSTANEIFVEDDTGTPIWSSNACPTTNTAKLVQLVPGAIYRVSLKWPTTRDSIKCGEVGAPVGTGSYTLHARNGSVQSEPAAITLK